MARRRVSVQSRSRSSSGSDVSSDVSDTESSDSDMSLGSASAWGSGASDMSDWSSGSSDVSDMDLSDMLSELDDSSMSSVSDTSSDSGSDSSSDSTSDDELSGGHNARIHPKIRRTTYEQIQGFVQNGPDAYEASKERKGRTSARGTTMEDYVQAWHHFPAFDYNPLPLNTRKPYVSVYKWKTLPVNPVRQFYPGPYHFYKAWTPHELTLMSMLMELFKTSRLPAIAVTTFNLFQDLPPNGITLRQYLAWILRCKKMRITSSTCGAYSKLRRPWLTRKAGWVVPDELYDPSAKSVNRCRLPRAEITWELYSRVPVPYPTYDAGGSMDGLVQPPAPTPLTDMENAKLARLLQEVQITRLQFFYLNAARTVQILQGQARAAFLESHGLADENEQTQNRLVDGWCIYRAVCAWFNVPENVTLWACRKSWVQYFNLIYPNRSPWLEHTAMSKTVDSVPREIDEEPTLFTSGELPGPARINNVAVPFWENKRLPFETGDSFDVPMEGDEYDAFKRYESQTLFGVEEITDLPGSLIADVFVIPFGPGPYNGAIDDLITQIQNGAPVVAAYIVPLDLPNTEFTTVAYPLAGPAQEPAQPQAQVAPPLAPAQPPQPDDGGAEDGDAGVENMDFLNMDVGGDLGFDYDQGSPAPAPAAAAQAEEEEREEMIDEGQVIGAIGALSLPLPPPSRARAPSSPFSTPPRTPLGPSPGSSPVMFPFRGAQPPSPRSPRAQPPSPRSPRAQPPSPRSPQAQPPSPQSPRAQPQQQLAPSAPPLSLFSVPVEAAAPPQLPFVAVAAQQPEPSAPPMSPYNADEQPADVAIPDDLFQQFVQAMQGGQSNKKGGLKGGAVKVETTGAKASMPIASRFAWMRATYGGTQ